MNCPICNKTAIYLKTLVVRSTYWFCCVANEHHKFDIEFWIKNNDISSNRALIFLLKNNIRYYGMEIEPTRAILFSEAGVDVFHEVLNISFHDAIKTFYKNIVQLEKLQGFI